MSAFKKFAGNWLGFTRRERRSTFVLLVIIVIVLSIRFVVPSHRIKVEEIPVDLSQISFFQDTVSKPARGKAISGTGSRPAAGKPLTDLNHSDSTALVALPGIGPVLSARIIKYRNLLGGFVSVEQLKEVYGLPAETYDLICKRVFADSLSVRKIKVNDAEFKDLIRHPYFKKNEVEAILKYRQLSGRMNGPEDMLKNNLISEETFRKIKAYLEF
ncbi:MAG TPA: helix-hairpin-helix domain-containing protein [Bacteroidales bacterium]|jgi:DNA uptake protein ComE-like DNA-binding protein|nr:helix-hairpin-helix domain-containing protein [Bacteroidales bacterium]